MTRVVLCDVPGAGVVAALVRAHSRLELVAQVGVSGLLDAARRYAPDAVVMGAEGRATPRVCRQLLSEHRSLRVLCLHDGGRTGVLHWVGVRPRKFEDLSVSAMLTALTDDPELSHE